MICNRNEKYLLRFISGACTNSVKEDSLLEFIRKHGLKIQFKNDNPIYQIIDELSYSDYLSR